MKNGRLDFVSGLHYVSVSTEEVSRTPREETHEGIGHFLMNTCDSLELPGHPHTRLGKPGGFDDIG